MNALKTLSGRRASQNPWELAQLIALFRRCGVRRYLEIGARHGDTFHVVMSGLPVGSYGCALDLPGGAWGTPTSKEALADACGVLRNLGYEIDMVLGDSTADATINHVMRRSPFDAVLIDGDHRYEGVRRDWLAYGSMARLVAFHDIAGAGQIQPSSGLPVEVPRLWNEVVASLAPGRRAVAFVAPASTMGIGVVMPEDMEVANAAA